MCGDTHANITLFTRNALKARLKRITRVPVMTSSHASVRCSILIFTDVLRLLFPYCQLNSTKHAQCHWEVNTLKSFLLLTWDSRLAPFLICTFFFISYASRCWRNSATASDTGASKKHKHSRQKYYYWQELHWCSFAKCVNGLKTAKEHFNIHTSFSTLWRSGRLQCSFDRIWSLQKQKRKHMKPEAQPSLDNMGNYFEVNTNMNKNNTVKPRKGPSPIIDIFFQTNNVRFFLGGGGGRRLFVWKKNRH